MYTDNTIVYYSTNTKLAYEINEKYYDGVHYIWCCPFFFKRGHAASSTPRNIFQDLTRDVETEDENSAKIRQNISGIIKGAGFKLNQGIITKDQYDEIEYRVLKKWKFSDFKPFIYIIPTNDEVKRILLKVSMHDKASPDSSEMIIEQIKTDLFDIISMEGDF